ncbi:hypothetical protein VNO80_10313 [Phaseolus coccineus]|uniref:glucan endo-1,3-beta-D-glucosidase n=1 Tax=Phaseolus coccineus TaxID=3886 RepID=A0AAN9NEB4_PHACN
MLRALAGTGISVTVTVAKKSLHNALSLANLTAVQLSTPHSLGILASSEPPSATLFCRGYDKAIFAPILDFHRRTKSPFMVNPYPFFGFDPTRPESLNYALFKPNGGVWDAATSVNYTNMFDAQMDPWPEWSPVAEPNESGVSFDNTVSYSGNLMKHLNSGKGTPLMPNRIFETFIFSLFNENLQPIVCERNYGLFNPDLTTVYHLHVFIER